MFSSLGILGNWGNCGRLNAGFIGCAGGEFSSSSESYSLMGPEGIRVVESTYGVTGGFGMML